jgi:hypothetical protein
MKKLLFAAAVLLLASCDSATVPERLLSEVYEYRLSTPALRVLRWPAASTVRVYAAPDADPARTTSLENALAQAIDVWNAAALYGEVQLQQTSDLAQADAVLLFSSTLPPVDMTGCPRGAGLAVTTFCLHAQDQTRLATFPPAAGSGAPGRVKFVVTVASVVTDAELARRLVAHELGHVLGIAQHSPRAADLMFGNTLTTALPSAADRATLQLLYQTRPDITP